MRAEIRAQHAQTRTQTHTYTHTHTGSICVRGSRQNDQKSCYTYSCVTFHIEMRHVSHTNESRCEHTVRAEIRTQHLTTHTHTHPYHAH